MPDRYHDNCHCASCREVREATYTGTLARHRAALEAAAPHDPVPADRFVTGPVIILPKETYGRSPGQEAVDALVATGYTHRLPTDSKARKNIPIYSGLIAYFPLACAAVAKHSKDSNDQHNPGEPMHWAREKSTDHLDCIVRHLADRALADSRGDVQERLVAQRAIAWRALAQLELDEEAALAAGDTDRAVHHD